MINMAFYVQELLHETGLDLPTLSEKTGIALVSLERMMRLKKTPNIIDALIPYIFASQRPGKSRFIKIKKEKLKALSEVEMTNLI